MSLMALKYNFLGCNGTTQALPCGKMIPLPLPSIENSLLDSSRPLNKSLGKQKAILSMPMCPSLARMELGVFCLCPSRQGARQSSRAITLQIFSDCMSCQFCQTSVLQMAKHSLTQRLLKAAERSDWGWKNHWFGSTFLLTLMI